MECTQNTDLLKLVREGTSQEQRLIEALSPGYAPVDERTPAHHMVFARAYTAYLNYYDSGNTASGDWQRFFANDVSVLLATAAIQDIDAYSVRVQEIFAFLNNLDNDADIPGLGDHLGNLFAIAGTIAWQLDLLKAALPVDLGLKTTLANLIQSQLATGFRRLIAYYKGGLSLTVLNDVTPVPAMRVLGADVVPFSDVISVTGLSADWITDGSPDWATFEAAIAADISVFGSGPTVFEKVNHIATHNLFTAVFDQLLKVYSRTVADAKLALESTLTEWDKHEPHYTLFLSFLRLNEYARQETNTLTARHLDFYYRDILRLKEKPAVPGQAHLLLELAKHVDTELLEAGSMFKAGKDDLGKEALFASDRDLVANKGKVVQVKTVYRHKNKTGDALPGMNNRLFAAPVSNSEDGLGAPILAEDQSWHPFFNKIYTDGALTEIKMPKATVGFAIGSHYLYMAEGTRKITVDFTIDSTTAGNNNNLAGQVTCMLTTADGWMEKAPVHFKQTSATNLQLEVDLEGNDAAITPYDVKKHGYQFNVTLPVLLLTLRQDTNSYIYSFFEETKITNIALKVDVTGLKTLAVTNDFGPVDTSKPFQPFGPSPIINNNFIFGSKELFSKNCSDVKVNMAWQVSPVAYTSLPQSSVSYLKNGIWSNSETESIFSAGIFPITLNNFNNAVKDVPNFSPNEPYATSASNGFAKIALLGDFGQATYLTALRDYLIAKANGQTPAEPTPAPVFPVALNLSVNYIATQQIPVSSSIATTFNLRKARFFHVGPFGEAEKHAFLDPLAANKVHLLPQFDFQRDGLTNESVAEFYIGVSDLQPPQNLALLFQVSDGTADPLSKKPDPGKHIHWSYLQGNEWAVFPKDAVEDATGELTKSGIVTLSFPREATSANTILPTGMYWIRLAVWEKSEAVCRLLMVAAQAVLATFTDKGNDPAFPAKTVAAGTISKLSVPDAAVKKVTQPFDSFNGRGSESSDNFYKRISERLRHKDRAITLWDYEHLILEAFPMIYKAKCLNHTEYEPTVDDKGIYRELAPGHVTIVTIPNQEQQNVRNPLRPYTSLGTLLDIEAFLKKRLSCFVKLHVKNPKFEEVKTEFKVRFFPGFDETFYLKKLQEEITRFLSPWAFPGGGSPSFGGKIYKSVLVNFIEERPWVDYVADFKLRHKPYNAPVFSKDLNEAEASTAVSILVSVPASQHIITLITTTVPAGSVEKCPCES